MSYAVLHAADFALQAVVRTEADLDGKPAALLEDRARQAVIVQTNASARAAGPRRSDRASARRASADRPGGYRRV